MCHGLEVALAVLLVVVVLNLSCSETESDPRIDGKAGKVHDIYDLSSDKMISDDQTKQMKTQTDRKCFDQTFVFILRMPYVTTFLPTCT